MTINELLKCSAAELKLLTDEELKKHFEPMLKVTRPELAEKPKNTGKRVTIASAENALKNAKKAMAMKMAEELGIDLDLEF